ncbi:MAG TPA: thioredoxin domain-containing protein [Solirubrobacterales bacterium]
MSEGGSDQRRQNLLKIASAAVFLAVIAVAVLIVVSTGEDDGGDADAIEGAAQVNKQLQGIPQDGLVLGESGAKVKLVEFGDLKCPVCASYAEEVIPEVIDSEVRTGQARIEFRSYTIIDEQSGPAGAAAIAAGEQGRGWNFVEIFYRNQGNEAAAYVTDEFLTAVAEAAGVKDIARWDRDRQGSRAINEVAASTAAAEKLGFTGTPSFAVEGPATDGLEPFEAYESPVDQLEAAIAGAQ